jgi:hypothetical protein
MGAPDTGFRKLQASYSSTTVRDANYATNPPIGTVFAPTYTNSTSPPSVVTTKGAESLIEEVLR